MGQVLPFHYVPGDMFTWTNGIGVVEDSTLNANGYDYFTSHIVVKSHKTGVYKTFYYTDDILDEDGDALAFVYESEDGFRLEILND